MPSHTSTVIGGTNPSLLEALESTKLNLLLDVGFNREVGEDGALYWKKDRVAHVIDQAEQLDAQSKISVKNQVNGLQKPFVGKDCLNYSI